MGAARDLYLLRISDLLGEVPEAGAAYGRLMERTAHAEPESLVLAFAGLASGYRALGDAQLQASLSHLQRARIGVPFLAFVHGPLEGIGLLYQPLLAWNLWLTALVEQASERPEEARRWYRSAAQSGLWSFAWHEELARLSPCCDRLNRE